MKKIYWLPLLALMLLFTCVGALAEDEISAVTITSPTTGSYVDDTYAFAGTYTGNSSANVTIFYNDTFVCADTTVTVANSTWTCSGSLSSISDCTALVLNASAYNTTGTISASITTANIYSDATSPSVTSWVSDFEGQYQEIFKDHTYTVVATDTCDTSLTYSVVLTKPDGVTVTKTSSSATWRDTDVDMIGSFSAALTVTDNAGKTDTDTLTFDVKGGDNDITRVVGQQQIQEQSSSSMFVLLMLGTGVLLIVVLLGVGIWWFNKK